MAQARSTTGIILMVAAVTCFAGLDGTAKWTSQTLPPLETVGLRYLSGFVFVMATCRPWARASVVRTSHAGLQIVRALSLVLATIFSFTASHYLPLGQATALQFASPLVVALLAGPLLGEWPGPARVVAIIAGFLGVVVVTRPGVGMHPAVAAGLMTALCNAAYALLTRQLAGRDGPLTTLFYSGLVGAIAISPVLPFVFEAPQGLIWLAMVLMGGLATLGHYLLILANERAAASTLAPFTYAQLVGATLVGWLVFGDVPDRWALAGGTIVAGSGIAMLFQERRPRG